MSTYVYQTARGPVEIETDTHWADILKGEDKAEQASERKHTRPDHKYAPGEPLALEWLRFEGARLGDCGHQMRFMLGASPTPKSILSPQTKQIRFISKLLQVSVMQIPWNANFAR